MRDLAGSTSRPRPSHEVKGVGHRGVGEEAHAAAFVRLAQDGEKGSVVLQFVEHLGTGVAAFEDVIRPPPSRSGCGSRHARTLTRTTAPVNN